MADQFTERALRNLRERHETAIRQNAERIQEHIGYVLKRLDGGNVTSVSHYANGIAADAREIVNRLSALEGMADVKGIYDSETSQ